jgi:hypothetical protein
MKAKICIILSVLFTVALTSCDPNVIGGDSNYWNSNTLVRFKLKGKVKTLVTFDGSQTDYFNEKGFITKSVWSANDLTSTTFYNYDKDGKLESTEFISTSGTGTNYTTTFEYQNIGKYIVQHPFHFDVLVPNLKASYSPFTRIDYKFVGEKMYLISTYINGTEETKDTATVTYSGKYPASLTTPYGRFVKDIKYASNGMFLSYTEGTEDENYSSENKYVYKPDPTYLLVDSVVRKTTNQSGTTIIVDKYEYDANKNTIIEELYGYVYQYTYVFDKNGNWTSRTVKSRPKTSSTWSATTTETRTITYWE